MAKEPLHVENQDLFVPHRVVQVGAASTDDSQEPIPADTVKDPVGKAAIAKANEDVRDLPKREKVIKVGAPGERNRGLGAGGNGKVPSMVPDAIGEAYPGEHRYAYQLEPGDRILNLGQPNDEVGRWVLVKQVEITTLEGERVNAEIHGVGETGYYLVLHMQANAQVRLVTNQEEPYG